MECGLAALGFQWLSCVHSLSRHTNCLWLFHCPSTKTFAYILGCAANSILGALAASAFTVLQSPTIKAAIRTLRKSAMRSPCSVQNSRSRLLPPIVELHIESISLLVNRPFSSPLLSDSGLAYCRPELRPNPAEG